MPSDQEIDRKLRDLDREIEEIDRNKPYHDAEAGQEISYLQHRQGELRHLRRLPDYLR
ncbi:MAG: hypothetical protein WC654_00220 [Patescibacteria group bacterium]